MCFWGVGCTHGWENFLLGWELCGDEYIWPSPFFWDIEWKPGGIELTARKKL